MITRNLKRISVTTIAFVTLFCCMFGNTIAYANKTSLSVPANVYDLDKDSNYVIGEASPSTSSAIGTLSIKGVVKVSDEMNSFPAYEVRDGNAAFAYRISSSILNHAEDEWHLIDDKTKKVNGLTLDSNILSGALILQTSLDGVTWTEDILMSDIFADDTDTDEFYTTKDVQLQNGCYYRVIVAYKMERRTEDSKILFVTTKNYEYKQVAEVYEFYAFCETDETSPDATPLTVVQDIYNAGTHQGACQCG